MNMKKILTEWGNFLNENRIISLAELVNIISSNEQYTDDDIDKFTNFWNSNQFSSKYSQVIKNDLEKGEPIEHIVDAVTSHYNKVYQSAGPKIKSAIGDGSYSADDLRKDLDAKVQSGSFNKLEVRQQCQYSNGRPVVGKYKDFDVVYSKSDWIVIEPKTIQGSIAWGHGKPDGSEETDQARRVGWCTAVSSGNNMFPNYAGNLHMFYLIKSNYDNTKGPERRLCLSYAVEEGKAKIKFGNSSVDANNKSISEDYINKIVSKNILKLIESLVSGRKETSFSNIYSKITLPQLIRQIKQMKSQRIDDQLIAEELSNYARYAKSKEVIFYLFSSFIENKELNHAIKSRIALREDLLKIDLTGDLIDKIIKDEDVYIRRCVANNTNITTEILSDLAKDEDYSVRIEVARNINTTPEILLDLAKDENVYIRSYVTRNTNITPEILLDLAKDEDSNVRAEVARNINTPKKALLILAKDKDFNVKRYVANNRSSPKKALLILAKDENPVIRDIAVSALENIKSESILRSYIKLIIS